MTTTPATDLNRAAVSVLVVRTVGDLLAELLVVAPGEWTPVLRAELEALTPSSLSGARSDPTTSSCWTV